MLDNNQIQSVKKWNELVKNAVDSALGSKLNGEFIAANYTAGFPFIIKQTYYNKNSLNALDTLVTVQDDIPYLSNVFSNLYNQVISDLEYTFSKADQDKIEAEQTNLSAMTGKIIEEYKNSQLDDAPKDYPTIMYIMQRIKEVTGSDYLNVDLVLYPNLSNLCMLLSRYAEKGVNTSKMQNAWCVAFDRLKAIKNNIENPSDENGGLRVDNSTCLIGWDNLMDSDYLMKQLQGDSSVSFSVSINNISSTMSDLHFESDVKFSIPFNWFFNITVDHEHSYDLSKLANSESSLDINITYSGLTLMPANPKPISKDNKTGWYDSEILSEAATKSGKDSTGYKLSSGRFDPKVLFGKDGTLRRLNTFVLSRQPKIELTFQKFNCKALSEIFSQKTDVAFNIFGSLISGTHNNDYTFSDYEYNSDEQIIKVSIVPASLTSGGASSELTAFVLGGVAEYFEGA